MDGALLGGWIFEMKLFSVGPPYFVSQIVTNADGAPGLAYDGACDVSAKEGGMANAPV